MSGGLGAASRDGLKRTRIELPMSVLTVFERDKLIDHTFGVFQDVQRAASGVDVVRAIEHATCHIGVKAIIILDRQLCNGRLSEALHLDRGRYVLNHLVGQNIINDPVVQHLRQAKPSLWSVTDYEKPGNQPIEDFRDAMLAQGVGGGLAVPMYNPAGLRGAAVWNWARDVDPQRMDQWSLVALSSVALDRIEALRGPARLAGTDLSPRERDCLLYTAEGLTAPQVAEVLGLSTRTVEAYLRSAALKLGATSRPQAIAAALRLGLLV